MGMVVTLLPFWTATFMKLCGIGNNASVSTASFAKLDDRPASAHVITCWYAKGHALENDMATSKQEKFRTVKRKRSKHT